MKNYTLEIWTRQPRRKVATILTHHLPDDYMDWIPKKAQKQAKANFIQKYKVKMIKLDG